MAELLGREILATALPAPRLLSVSTTAAGIVNEALAAATATATAEVPTLGTPGRLLSETFAQLCQSFHGVDVVINAAGLATPGDGESPELTGANALLPAVVVLAARAAGVRRVIHLSSASVQGHRLVIDESPERAPFSPYSRSKALGEEALEVLAANSSDLTNAVPNLVASVVPRVDTNVETNVVTIRATSVQGLSRPTTRSLIKIAGSPLSSVAAPGTAPTPVSSIDALAWFVAETAQHLTAVPSLVLQPWEGLSVTAVLAAAGGRKPIKLPAGLCRLILSTGYACSKMIGERLHGPLRRVELMWFGQAQTPGWAEEVGLIPASRVSHLLQQARLSHQ